MQGRVLAITDKFGGSVKMPDGKWYRYAYGYAGDKPNKGDEISLELNAKGYITGFSANGSAPVSTPAAAPEPTPGFVVREIQSGMATKASRAHALNAAARIVSRTPQVTSGECEPDDVIAAVRVLTEAFAKIVEGEE